MERALVLAVGCCVQAISVWRIPASILPTGSVSASGSDCWDRADAALRCGAAVCGWTRGAAASACAVSS